MSNHAIVEVQKPYRLRTLTSLIEDGTPTTNANMAYLSAEPILERMRKYISQLKACDMVRVYIESTGFPHKTPESPWLIIEKVRGTSFQGRVNSRMQRGGFHGVEMGTLLEFNREHIVDIWLNVETKPGQPKKSEAAQSIDMTGFFGKKPKGKRVR